MIRRPRLHARLAVALASRVTLVRAEAGSGKTTLLADFVRRSSLPRRHGCESTRVIAIRPASWPICSSRSAGLCLPSDWQPTPA